MGLRALMSSRELLWVWTLREVQVRYKHAYLGAAWAVLQPLGLMLAFVALAHFLPRMPSRGVPYPLFFYSAVLPWTFFASAITFASTSLILNMQMVTKAAFPREVLPLASVGAALFDYLMAAAVFAVLLLFYGMPLSGHWIWIPPLLLLQVFLAVGLGLLAGGLVALFRDLRFVVPVALQMLLFLTPIAYSLDSVPERWQAVVMASPMAVIVQSFRQVTVFGERPDLGYLSWAVVATIALVAAGLALFRRINPTLADRI